jgi:FKBP-type peptidyl-prolyl cis-trans isomerase
MKKIFVLILLLFVAGCSKKPDIVTLKSGVKYADDTVGTGVQSKFGDLVNIQFTGWKIQDSTDFYNIYKINLFGLYTKKLFFKDTSVAFKDWSKDSSKMHFIFGTTKFRAEPLKIILNGQSFIKGSEEAIAGMRAGGTRTIILPATIPYAHGAGDRQPPHPGFKLQVKLVSAKTPVEVKPWVVDTTNYLTTKDGLRYIIVQAGTGPKVADTNIVTINYSGFLIDGNKFDSSVQREEPLTFKVGMGNIIKGMVEGLKLLNKGAKAKLIMPPSLAYGARQVVNVPPNSTVVFDVEVVDIK